MSELILDHIVSIESKLKALIKNYLALAKENTRLKLQLDEREKENLTYKSSNENLLQQLHIIKTSLGTLNEEEKAIFGKSINQYIKTIELCIAHLNQ
ncbi:MAG: hypothetical protein ABI168_10040 [Ginsengibacter sp.]